MPPCPARPTNKIVNSRRSAGCFPNSVEDFPQLRLCLSGDSLYACGRTLQLAKDYHFNYVLTFKPGHMPAVWEDFQSLLKLCPENTLERTTPGGVHQVYRWVHDLSYRDDQGRTWRFNAIECKETVDGETTTFAWITDLKVDAHTVEDIATKGGRHRWHIENQGFNRQKNSGLNLEHVFSTDPEKLKAYYYLLQIAHMILQVMEAGSLLRNLAAEFGRTPMQLFGSLKNLARRLLEAFRYIALSDQAFDPLHAAGIQIRFDTFLAESERFPGLQVTAAGKLMPRRSPPRASPLPVRPQLPALAGRRLPGRIRPGVFLRAA